MVAITRALAPIPAVAEPAGRSSPELDAKARTCRAQLADWVTCPSARTPAGKAKIEQITARLDLIKQEIKASDGTSSADPGSARDAPSPLAAATGELAAYRSGPSPVGVNVDTTA